MKKFFQTQLGRFVVGLLALIVVVGVNLSARDAVSLRADVTSTRVMTPSETSLQALRALEKDVQINYLATERDKELWVDELAARFAAASGHVDYRLIDPNGGEAEKLAALAGGTLAEGTLAVVQGDRCVAIAPDEMYAVTYNEMYYYYYGQQVPETMYFQADELLLNAIQYVTDDSLPVIYALSGHGEQAVSGELLRQFQEHNLRVSPLTLSGGEAPSDAAAILINKPASDISQEESKALLSYLKEGGRLVLTSDYTFDERDNLEAVMAYYGMQAVGNALALESDNDYRYSSDYPYYLTPALGTHDITAAAAEAGASVLIPLSGALERNSIRRAGLSVEPLLTTSDSSYLKSGAAQVSSLDPEEGDASGPFVVAMAASEGVTRVVWLNGDCLVSDILTYSPGNISLLDGLFRWIAPVKELAELESENLVMPTLALSVSIRPLLCAVVFLPALAALVVGLIRRRKAVG